MAPLRHLIAAELANGAAQCDLVSDDVLVTSGGQAALVAAFRGLARPGDTVVMESPTFWGAIAAVNQAGLTIVPVASRPDGPDPAELERAVAIHRGAGRLRATDVGQPDGHDLSPAVWSPCWTSSVPTAPS